MREEIEIVKPESIVTENGIYGFFGEYRFLSNFHLAEVKLDGRTYPATENAYMAAKTLDQNLRDKFASIKPNEARRLGQTIELRSDWEDIKYSVMLGVNLYKYTHHKDLLVLLKNTAPKYLEETNYWGDKYWGVCKNEGQNNLGKVLMTIRDAL